MMKKVSCMVMILTLLFGIIGCGTIENHKEKPQYEVGIVLKALDSPYWQDMKSGLEQAALDHGIDMILLYPEGEKEEEEQSLLIHDLLEREVDLLLMAPCDSYDTTWIANKAGEKKIPVLTVDTRAYDADFPYIGSDNYTFGKLVAEYFNAEFKNGGKILLMFGPENQSSIRERYEGIVDYLNESIQIQDVQYMELKERYGFAVVDQMDSSVDGIFCQNSVLARGVVEALAEKNGIPK